MRENEKCEQKMREFEYTYFFKKKKSMKGSCTGSFLFCFLNLSIYID